jgi:hypothetical protein
MFFLKDCQEIDVEKYQQVTVLTLTNWCLIVILNTCYFMWVSLPHKYGYDSSDTCSCPVGIFINIVGHLNFLFSLNHG